MAAKSASAEKVRAAWRTHEEIALFDVREEGPFSRAHPLFAVSLPLSRLEIAAFRLAPRLDVPVVVYDDGEGYAEEARRRLEAWGYTDVSVLADGLSGWAATGEVFRDVNSYSKAFGEWVEANRHTPSIPAAELHTLIESGADLAILDARRFDEYQTMSIPFGRSAPGGELVYRAFDAIRSTDTLVVVNCAGRTRSIIGAQSLINAGLPNRVVALRNGTIGWSLAGLSLDHGKKSQLPTPGREGLANAIRAARNVASRAGVPSITWHQLEQWRADRTRTLYQFDVRTAEEFVAGHIPGFRHAAGGQLVQATDEYVGIRGARIVLADNDGVRATMTASWLIQMGWRDVAVLRDHSAEDESESGWPADPLPSLPSVSTITPGELAQANFLVLDLALSPEFTKGHIPQAWFAVRAQFESIAPSLPESERIVLTSPDGILASFAAADAHRAFGRPIAVLKGGTQAWRAEDRPLDTGIERTFAPVDDVYKRPYEGTNNATAAMEAYIAWELELVAQLKRDGTCNFKLL
jgi:rhodanese-related sulfurtransferase